MAGNPILGLLLAPLVLAALAVALLAAPLVLGWNRWRSASLRRRFEAKWGPEGKVGLLVYSNSPHWQEYVETRWCPHLTDRMVVLNWSERRRWPDAAPLEGKIHAHWAGDREYNPVAIVFPAGARPAVLRFRKPFRDYRHGRPAALLAAESELARLTGATGIGAP